MSRFLFAPFGSLGDLHPYIAIARALVERGHEAVIAVAEDYRPAVEGAGIEFAAVRPSLSELGDYQPLLTRLFDARHGPEYLIRELVMPHLRTTYEHLLQAAAGADLLITHPLAFTLPMVAEQNKLPWVATVLSPMSILSAYDPPALAAAPWLRSLRVFGPGANRWLFRLFKRVARDWEAPVHAFRAELGLPPLPGMALFEGQFSPLLNLALFDAQLAQPQPDWPAHTRTCGAPMFDGSKTDLGLPEELERFLADGEPPIVFALGSSAVWVAGDFWKHAIAAVQRRGRRAVLVTGPTVPEDLPAGIQAFPYLPYSRLFPRAAAVVHQAGIGTLAQAMRAGRPQLIVPVAFDQPDNAERAKALGLGRVLPFRRVTAQRLAAELDLLLARPGYAQAASSLAKELATTDGAAHAADQLIVCLGSDPTPHTVV